MPTTGSLVILGNHVYFYAERSGRSVRFEVYKIANAPDADPQEIYTAFKQVAADLFRADVVSPRYDPPVEVPETAVVEETPNDAAQEPTLADGEQQSFTG